MATSMARRVSISLMSGGVGLLTIVSTPSSYLSFLHISPSFLPFGAGIGLLVVIAGGLLWFASMPQVIYPWVGKNAEYFEFSNADYDDLPSIRAMAMNHFGNTVATVETMQRWIRKNPKTLRVLGNEKDGVRTIVGYYSIIPLTARGESRLLHGDVTGSTLSQDDIASRLSGQKRAIYISGIAANGRTSRANVLSLLAHDIAALKGDKTIVYTRPVTKDGLRLCKKFGFIPVHPEAPDTLRLLYKAMASELLKNAKNPLR